MKTKDFLINSDETGRFIVVCPSGRKYFVEPIYSHGERWGDYNPATGKFEQLVPKFTGAVDQKDSLVTDINFDKHHLLQKGESPLEYIQRLEEKYENESSKLSY